MCAFILVWESLCVCVCIAALRQVLSTVEEFLFFFFPVLIPHSDHSSSACTRKTNNASDMSLVEQRLFAQPSPPFLLTLLSTRSTVQCVSVLSIDSSQSDKSLHLDYLGFI